MASALLASRNEPCWGDRKVYMRKNNPNSNWNSNSNPNPNPNPKHHKTKRATPTPPPDKPPGPGGIYDSFSSIPIPKLHHHYHHHDDTTAAPLVSDDSSSLNHKFADRRESLDSGGYVTFNISTFSRRELKDLRKRLISELNQVRSLADRIESREFQSRSGYSATAPAGFGAREVTSFTNHPPSNDGASEGGGRSKVSGYKRSYPPTSLATGRDRKRSALDSVAAASVQPATERLLADMMKKCGQCLTKLMKQKFCWIFNTPVDVVGMGLHDYYQIVKHPMDLGTVKTKLRKNFYNTPLDFASDVRLTFNNALVYNPSGHDVYNWAKNLLSTFEAMFEPAFRSYEEERQHIVSWAEKMKQKSASSVVPKKSVIAPSPFPSEQHQHKEKRRSFEEKEIRQKRSISPLVEQQKKMPQQNSWNQNRRRPTESNPASLAPPDVQTPAPASAPPPTRSTGAGSGTMRTGSGSDKFGKQPKPKAKDKNKRDMSFEEKQKLSLCLQSLPPEKMDQVVTIIKKRNPDLAAQGDEIEVDIEVVDKETLWELDRFVGYFKKMMSKMKRQALASAQPAAPAAAQDDEDGRDDKRSIDEEIHNHPVVAAAAAGSANNSKKIRKGGEIGGGGAEEEIDIGEDMPATNFPPVEIEKDAGGGAGGGGGGVGGGYASGRSSSSSSSSSGSSSDDDSSSNSDSDSGSSSGSDSDEAQSPRGGGESKAVSGGS